MIERTFLNTVIKTAGSLINIMVENALYCTSETVYKRLKIMIFCFLDNYCDSFHDENGRLLRLELWFDLTILIYLFPPTDYIDNNSQRNTAQRIVSLPQDWPWLTTLRRLDFRRHAAFSNNAERSNTMIMNTRSYDRKNCLCWS